MLYCCQASSLSDKERVMHEDRLSTQDIYAILQDLEAYISKILIKSCLYSSEIVQIIQIIIIILLPNSLKFMIEI